MNRVPQFSPWFVVHSALEIPSVLPQGGETITRYVHMIQDYAACGVGDGSILSCFVFFQSRDTLLV